MKKIFIKGITIFIILLMLTMNIGFTLDAQSKTYYVSPEGNDDNTGLTAKAAWKTIERVNRDTLQPGDAILFESGGTLEISKF